MKNDHVCIKLYKRRNYSGKVLIKRIKYPWAEIADITAANCCAAYNITISPSNNRYLIIRHDRNLGKGRNWLINTRTSPFVPAKNKILKIVYFCVGRQRRYSLNYSNGIIILES